MFKRLFGPTVAEEIENQKRIDEQDRLKREEIERHRNMSELLLNKIKDNKISLDAEEIYDLYLTLNEAYMKFWSAGCNNKSCDKCIFSYRCFNDSICSQIKNLHAEMTIRKDRHENK